MALGALGVCLISRSEGMYVFVVSQSAIFGVAGYLLFCLMIGLDAHHFLFGPTVFGFLSSLAVYFICQLISKSYKSKTIEWLMVVFIFLIACNYLIISMFPALEKHFTASFFGNIVTASVQESIWLASLGGVFIIFISLNFKKILFQNFWELGSGLSFYPKIKKIFNIFALILIAEATRLFGFLFTSSCILTLPLLISLQGRSLRPYMFTLVLFSGVSTLVGFGLSMVYQNLSTSSVIVVSHVALGVLYSSALWLKKSRLRV